MFKKLLDEISAMNKSLPAVEDEKVEGAQAVAEGDSAEAATSDEQIAANGEDDLGEDEDLKKSMTTVKLEDGSEVEAFDGESLIKSFSTKIEAQKTGVEEVLSAQNQMIKSLAEVVTSQSTMMKSMNDNLTKLGNSSKGRKTVINLQEKPDLNKSLDLDGEQKAGIKPHEFHQKLSKALKAEVITPHQAMTAETQINNGQNPSPDVVAKVMSVE